MAPSSPELIFISGPQKGERTLLMGVSGVIGRTPQCEICCKENFVSRQHVQLEMTQKGLVIENISANGTVVNGKRYKAGAKILLATGDIIGVGLETQMLYVAAGDDPEAALADYRKKHEAAAPVQAPVGRAAAPSGNPKTDELASAGAGAGVAPVAQGAAVAPILLETPAAANGAARPKAAGPAPVAIGSAPPPVPGRNAQAMPKAAPVAAPEQPKSKLRKYLKFILIYLGVMAFLVGLVIVLKSSDGDTMNQAGYNLSKEEIANALKSTLPRKINSAQAQSALADADKLYDRRTSDPGNLYKVVRNYKVYLASKDGLGVFEDGEHNSRYETALKELIDKVTMDYENGRAFEGKKDYPTAIRIYEGLLKELPFADDGTPVHEKLVKNILLHHGFVSRKKGK